MIEALAAGGVDAVARGEVGNLDAARIHGGAFAVTAHDSRVEVGGFALAAADAELAACLDRHIAWLTDNGRIGYREWLDAPVSRSSIYVTFGDRQALCVAVLRRYGPVSRAPGLSELRRAAAPRAALVHAFELLASAGADGKQSRKLCLLINTAMEPMPKPPEMAQIIEAAVSDMESRFRDAIERGRAMAEIAVDVDPVQTARGLLGLYLGLYLLVRSGGAGEPVLGAVVRQVEALLPAPSTAK